MLLLITRNPRLKRLQDDKDHCRALLTKPAKTSFADNFSTKGGHSFCPLWQQVTPTRAPPSHFLEKNDMIFPFPPLAVAEFFAFTADEDGVGVGVGVAFFAGRWAASSSEKDSQPGS